METVQQTTSEDENEPALATETSNVRFVPYYTMFGAGDERDFVLMRPFVPFSRDDQRRELQAFMTASSDADTYGELTVYLVADGEDGLPDGPLAIANAMESDPEISEQITLQQRRGSHVRFGDLQLVQVAGGLMWVRPFYVSAEQNSGVVRSVTEYAYIMATYDERSVYSPTLGGALAALFPSLDADIGERSDAPMAPVAEVDPTAASGDESDASADEPTTGSADGGSVGSGTPNDLLSEAQQLLQSAEEQLRNGDLGAYKEQVDQASALVTQALDQLGVDSAATSEPAVTATSEPGD